jgi:hypothetical protein
VLVSDGVRNQDTTHAFLHSPDHGETWESITPPEEGFIHCITFYNNRFWLVIDNTIYQSSDPGEGWTTEVMAYGSLRSLSFARNNPYIHGWAVGNVGTIIHYSFNTTPVIEQRISTIPKRWALHPNFPNPFNPETTIRYTVPEKGRIQLRIFDLLGREVALLLDREALPGSYQTTWNGIDSWGQPVSSGIYLYELRSGAYHEVRRMLLLR